MNVLLSIVAVGALFAIGFVGGTMPGLRWVFGVVIPYLALLLFFGGLIYRVLEWARVPVPFRIPTTCGQQKSLPWIKNQKLENPPDGVSAVGRMLLEVLFFRSLLRNTKSAIVNKKRVVYTTELWLWIGAMAMHWGFLIVLIRHLRLAMDPTPGFVAFVEEVDGFLEIGVPVIFISSFLLLAGVSLLLLRRLFQPHVRYISLATDYLPLVLIFGIALSGILMRHVWKVDVPSIKELAVGLAQFSPTVPATIGGLFFGHLFLVCVLIGFFPFSKLVHMAGVFLSPTRNLANSNRRVRHVNPWDYPVKVHSYDDYEDELRDKMKGAGVPVERP
jgi:nitrate reductase gamma subunit